MSDALIASAAHGSTDSIVNLSVESTAGTDHIFFRGAQASLGVRPEALVAALLLKAMAKGADLVVLNPFPDRFATGVKVAQDIYAAWFPELKRVDVRPESPVEVVGSDDRKSHRTGTFFTGGVDSFYTLLKHRDEIDTLVYVHGFDVPLEDEQLRLRISSMLRDVAEAMDMRLIEVETNLRSYYSHRLIGQMANWPLIHGAALAAVAHLLPDLSAMYVPSSYTYANLYPWGSHPLLDPRWSSTGMEIVHDGCEANRVDKCRLIAEHGLALNALRVCWKNPNGTYNCGRCEKCQRTMINLLAVDGLDRCTTFDVKLSTDDVSRLRIRSDSEEVFVSENLHHLRVTGNHPEIAQALKRVLLRYRLMYRWLDLPRKVAKRLLKGVRVQRK